MNIFNNKETDEMVKRALDAAVSSADHLGFDISSSRGYLEKSVDFRMGILSDRLALIDEIKSRDKAIDDLVKALELAQKTMKLQSNTIELQKEAIKANNIVFDAINEAFEGV